MDVERQEALSKVAEQVCLLCLCQAQSMLAHEPVNTRDICDIIHAAVELARADGIVIGPAKPLNELVDKSRYPRPSEWLD